MRGMKKGLSVDTRQLALLLIVDTQRYLVEGGFIYVKL